MRSLTTSALTLGFIALLSCQSNGDKPTETPQTAATPPAAAEASVKVRLTTSSGDIVLLLDSAKAPITVANFRKNVENKHYNGTAFHRVIDGFMIQGGGFTVSGNQLTEKATTTPAIKNEGQNGLKNLRGTIAMARTSDPDSARAQFFINVVDNAMLDHPNNGGYAVFGKVIEGMDVVDKIKAVATASGPMTMLHPATGQPVQSSAENIPTKPVIIESAVIIPAGS